MTKNWLFSRYNIAVGYIDFQFNFGQPLHGVTSTEGRDELVELRVISLLIILFHYLTVEQWRIVVDVGYLDRERANAFQRRISLVGSFNRDGHEFAIVAFSIEHLQKISKIISCGSGRSGCHLRH